MDDMGHSVYYVRGSLQFISVRTRDWNTEGFVNFDSGCFFSLFYPLGSSKGIEFRVSVNDATPYAQAHLIIWFHTALK